MSSHMIYSQSMKAERDRRNFDWTKEEKKRNKTTPEQMLATAVLEVKANPNDREAVWKFEQEYWKIYKKIVGKEIIIDPPPPNLTSQKIKEMDDAKKMILYIPKEITNTDITKMFPEIPGWINGKNSKVVDPTPQHGWIKAEASFLAPRLNKNPEGVQNELKVDDSKIISIKELAIAINRSSLMRRMPFDTTKFTHIRDKAMDKSGLVSKTTSFHAGVRKDGTFDIRMSRKDFHNKEVGIRTVQKL